MADNNSDTYKGVNFSATPVKSEAVDQVFRTSPSGSTATAIGDNFRGFNHRQAPSLIPINKDQYGMTFFTRPRMNLSEQNLRSMRKLAPLLSTRTDSIQRIIRCWLDPVNNKNGVFTSPYVDANMPFIPLLSNLLVSLPGWPDLAMPYSTSQEGVRKEQFNLADGTEEILRSVELVANFRNVSGDPITPLFEYWLTYMRGVYFGELLPHPDAILENEVDYDTRIYRLVLDEKKRYVTKIAATGWGFPVSDPVGAIFNYEADVGEGQLNQGLQQVSVNFVNTGIQYNDDILAWEFNQCNEQWFNPLMADIKDCGTHPKTGADLLPPDARSTVFRKVMIDELPIFNFKGYPRINLQTYELEWWVRKEEYRQQAALLNIYKTTRG
jgi:hypothetical protein